MKPLKSSHVLYSRYEYLANIYSNKLYDYDLIAFEREDFQQELKLRLYNAILAYAKKWKEYKDTGRYKPVPLVFYLKTVLNNRLKDYVKQIQKERECKMRIDDLQFDVGKVSSTAVIDFKDNVLNINGVDLLTDRLTKK